MVVLSSKALPDLRFNVDEYLQSDLPEGGRYELVNGEVAMTPTPDGEHDDPIDALQAVLYEYRKTHPEAVGHISQRASVPIPGEETVREPDLAVYCEWASAGRGWRVWKEHTPVLVVEVVSPGQASRDYEAKRRDYRLAGIPEYWIIDPQDRCVTVLVLKDGDWMETVFGPGQTIQSTVLPGLVVAVADVCD